MKLYVASDVYRKLLDTTVYFENDDSDINFSNVIAPFGAFSSTMEFCNDI